MQETKVSELASEFEMRNTVVISELKKVGVWVPSPDTTLDHDIADRIRRRLQLMVELEQQEEERTREEKEKKEKKKVASAKTRKSIKQLGTRRKRAKTVEKEEPAASPWVASLKPRKGKASYRKLEVVEPEIPQRIAVTIEDEPVIEKVEAHVSAEVLEKARHQLTRAELEKMTVRKEVQTERPALRKAREELERTTKVTQEPIEAPPVKEKALELETEPGSEEVAEAEGVAEPKEAPVSKTAQPVEVSGPREVTFSEKITVKELGEKLQLKSNELIKQLFSRGVMVSINQTLGEKIVQEICEVYNVIPQFVSFEEAAVEEDQVKEVPKDLAERPPVVTVMGHVDHGKTSLLDAIRETQVAAGEAGGITQQIGAYHVDVKGRRVVFIDTPGHAAFTRMRARGAQVTDLVVLVVAADDGVMPQTVEAIDHARAAGVPIIVALNKMDKPEADSQRVRQGLTEHELVAEEWGGDTVMVEVSAKEKTNLDLLLEMILLSADLLELKANPKRSGSGTVLEARLDRGRGAIASILIQSGTLKIGDSFIAGAAYGKVRAMFDDRRKTSTEAGPGTAVEILGLQSLPQAGDAFQVVEGPAKAREIGEYRQQQLRSQELASSSTVTLEDLHLQMEAGEVKELRIVLKADAQGSIEVLQDTLNKLSTEKVQVKIIHSAVGGVSESDVLLASASNAVIVGFNVRPEPAAKEVAEKEKVDVRLYTVIYEVSDEITQAMLGLLDPTFREKDLGRAEVRETFKVPKFGTIAGSYIQSGLMKRSAEVRLLRDNVILYTGEIDSLRRFKEDVNEVKEGYECGISITNFNDIKVGDVIEAFIQEEVPPELK
ncbi:MAG: translation initiation factor IF-2 [Acidobacteria bacterium]|nr:translation initiation factor IF-2 [Acidobacteriota bacterium]